MNLLIKTTPEGAIVAEIGLPDPVNALQRRFGFVTDNDGVVDSSGDTQFLRLGEID